MGTIFAVVLTIVLSISAIKSVFGLVVDIRRFRARRRILAFLDEVSDDEI